MAIKIPSKNIYQINNPKIRDNIVDKIEINQKIPNISYRINDFITSKEYTLETNYFPKINSSDDILNIFNNYKTTSYSSYSEVVDASMISAMSAGVSSFYKEFEITIPEKIDNKLIYSILDKKDLEDKNNIKTSITYNRQKIRCMPIWKLINSNTDVSMNNQRYGIEKLKIFYILEPEEIQKNLIPQINEYKTILRDDNANIELYIDFGNIDNSNISTAKFFYDKENKTYNISLKVLCGFAHFMANYGSDFIFDEKDETKVVSCHFNSVKGLPEKLGVETLGDNITNDIFYNNIYSFAFIEEAISISFSFYGKFVEINLKDKTVMIGEGNKPLSFDGNELMQKTENLYYKKCYYAYDGKLLNSDIFYCPTKLIKVEPNKNYKVDIFNFPSDTKVHNACLYTKDKIFIDYIPYSNGFSTINGTYYLGINFINRTNIEPLTGNEYFEVNGEIFSIANNYRKVISQYNKGKETATIRCSISDYYNESGEKVIDITTSNMSFRLHDEVIPYIYSANGEDVPMSKKQDGTPKVFEVVGSNIIYDGAVWQELTLQEK